MRTCQPDGTVEFVIPSDLNEARQVQDQIEKQLELCHFEDKEIFGIRLALEEAIVNAIKHGNRCDRSKKVQISYRVQQDHFEVSITDEGQGFDPTEVPDPTAEENLERPCGRGLMLMRHYMTHVSYNPRGNSVSMTKVFRTNNGKM